MYWITPEQMMELADALLDEVLASPEPEDLYRRAAKALIFAAEQIESLGGPVEP